MRSETLKYATILGVIASGALLVSCSHDAGGDFQPPSLLSQNGTTLAASLGSSSSLSLPQDFPEPATGPVDPATAKAAWKDGVASFESGDYKSAADKLKTAVAGEPGDPYRHYLLGLASWKSGDLPGAETSLVASTNLDATREKTWVNLARVRHLRSDRAGALTAAEKALELDPACADALHQKGRALMELGRGDEALQALSAARGIETGNGYIANTLGLLLIQLGRPGEAVQPLEAAKAALPQLAYVRNNLGVAYERIGRMDEAKLEYLAAVEAGDAGGKAMKSLARLGATDTTDSPGDAVATASVQPQ